MKSLKRVLVVDDDIVLLKMAEAILEETYQVILAKSGSRALRYLEKQVFPDVILLDVDMPEMDGYETLEQIRNIQGAARIPVIYLTGKTETETEVRCLESGACDFMTKPFSKEVLLSRIRLRIHQSEEKQEVLRKKVPLNGFSSVYQDALAKTLSTTEMKIAQLIALGYTNREIAEELNYSYSYVKKCGTLILNKLQLGHRGELRKLL